MQGGMTIGAVARRAGVPASTLRYYERAGLIPPAVRTESNYRIYDDGILSRIRFIRSAQSTGLTLEDIKELLACRDGLAAPCEEVRRLIEARLASVEARMSELERARRDLASLLESCSKSSGDACPALERLAPPVSLSKTS